MKRHLWLLTWTLVYQLVSVPLVSWGAPPRAFLKTDSGYLDREALTIDQKSYRVSNILMGTYDIADFEELRDKEPDVWRDLHNHYRYGVVGTRGFLGGAGLALAAALTSFGRSYPIIPIGLFLAGFVYGMNSRHMARHNLHKAINRMNGVQDFGSNPSSTEFDFALVFAQSPSLGFAIRF